jgi:glycine/D-amino acid oxidase-like deaminating enzyme
VQLSSGAPFWLLLNGLEEPPANPPSNCDVAIIGAGVTGALVADLLASTGFTVTVVDRRAPCEGSTGVCTGLLQYELDVELADLAGRIGEARAARGYRATASGLGSLEALVRTLPDDCGFARRSSLYLARRRRDAARLPKEADLRLRHGLDVEYWPRERVSATYGFPSHGALRTELAGVIDPVRFTRALLARAERAGAIVCPRTRLMDWSSDNDGVTLLTDRGTVQARWLVFATGYETPAAIRADLVNLDSTYAMATFPLDLPGGASPWHDASLVWDTTRPYTYLRVAEGGRILAGGEDIGFRDAAWRDRLLPGKTRALERRVRDLLPGVPSAAEYSWAGTFGATRDGLPCIGPHPGLPRALFALGYGGNGIVFSVIAAEVLRDVILGKGHPDLDLYALDRF